MLISLEWLNEYIDIKDITPEQIAHELTMSGLEVEEIEHVGAKFTNIKTAEIKEISQHPNADKLHLVKIFNGSETKEVVCGAQNIEVGQIIPYATIGSQVLDRKTGETYTLKPIKIRDVNSEGMLCSADELGLDSKKYQEEDGILILNRFIPDVKAGIDVKDVLNIKEDIVINVAPTANRGDEMSVIGIARELSSIFNKKLNFSYIECTQDLSNVDFKVEIKDEDTCKYYAAAILKNVKTKPSPDWMARRLEASGVRSINNIVDITNYVMLEYGQPLHAFDYDKLNGYLCVRRAKEGEKLITLDEVERNLTNDSVLIATQEEGVCVAGVFGGLNSEIDANTTSIALESAYFTPATNRKSARSIGYRSEASARFERGVNLEAVKPALMRAIQLLIEYADAKVEGIAEDGNNNLPKTQITLRFAQIKRILGMDIPASKCIEILDKLGFELLGQNDMAARFSVPGYRINDVTREIDLIEEIARINGYDKIAPTLPKKTVAPEVSDETRAIKKIHDLFLGKGFYEIITSSLTGKPMMEWFGIDYNDAKAVKVTNPQSEEHTMLRQNIMPDILKVVKTNFDKGQKNVWVYEIGKTYSFEGTPEVKNTGVIEKRLLAGALTGDIASNKWSKTIETDFYTLKGMMEAIISLFGLENRVQYKAVDNISYLHPGRTAEILLLGKTPTSLGIFGQIHPNTQDRLKLNQPVYIFELNLEAIIGNVDKKVAKFKQLPQFPEVQRDIAFAVPKEVSHVEIAKAIKKFASNKIFNGADLFDVYEGEHVQEGFKSVAYRIYLQDTDATLTDEKTDAEIKNIKEGLKKTFAEAAFRE